MIVYITSASVHELTPVDAYISVFHGVIKTFYGSDQLNMVTRGTALIALR